MSIFGNEARREVALQVYKTADGAGTPTSTTLVREAGALEYAGEITSDKWMCAEQVRCMLQEMRDGVQAIDVIIVNTPEANQVTLVRRSAQLQEELHAFLQQGMRRPWLTQPEVGRMS